MQVKKILIATTFTLALAGCGSLGSNTSMYSVHQPVVERTNYAIDVNVDGGGIPASEQIRMGEWFDAMKLRYGDRVAIDYGSSYADASTRRIVSDMVAEHGILVGDTAPVTNGPVVPGTVRIVMTRSSASVPSCPNWKTTGDANYNSSNHSNHGCSINSNLAAMIADPEDLVRGRDNEKLNSNSGTSAVNAHRAKTGGN